MQNNPFELVERRVTEWLLTPGFKQIKKVTRGGVTTSTVIVGLRQGKKVVVFAPTNKILEETISKAVKLAGKSPSDYLIIPRNSIMCPLSKPDPLFNWETKGNCKLVHGIIECEEVCILKQVKLNRPQCLGITYHKFLALVSAASKQFGNANLHASVSYDLLEILMDSDLILLDEIARTVIFNQKFNASKLSKIFKEIGLLHLKKEQRLAHEIFTELLDAIIIPKKPRDIINNPNRLPFYEAKKHGMALKGFFKAGESKTNFSNLVLASTAEQLVKVKLNGTQYAPKKEEIRVAPKNPTFMETFLDELHTRSIAAGAIPNIFITGAKLPDTKGFTWIEEVIMPDFNETEKQSLIVTDQANWNFNKGWDREKGKVYSILEKLLAISTQDKILVVAINKNKAQDIQDWIDKRNISTRVQVMEYPYYVTYYRNSDTLGVEMPYRIAVYVGLPWIPQDSYVENDLMYGEKEGTTNKIETSDTLMNALGRIKDPEGIKRSIAFILGGTLADFKKYSNKKEVVETHKQSSLHKVAANMAFLWLDSPMGHQHVCKYEDMKALPKIAEVYNIVYNVNGNVKRVAPNGKYNLKTFAEATLDIPPDEFRKLFERYRYMFPPHWKIYEKGRGHYIET